MGVVQVVCSYLIQAPRRKENILTICQYMLAFLFGICSGDKRYYECAEALHKQLLEVSR
jgi:hypothetical protein